MSSMAKPIKRKSLIKTIVKKNYNGKIASSFDSNKIICSLQKSIKEYKTSENAGNLAKMFFFFF